MIAFGSAVTKPDVFARYAEPGIRRAAEPDSQTLAGPAAGSIFRSYNAILDQAAAFEDLESLVLLHQDAEIVDRDFCPKLRQALSDPDVAVVGCVGAMGVRSIAWWEGSVTWASFVHRYGEPGQEFPSLTWDPDDLPPYAQTGEVDSVDGVVLALSAWAVRNLRFDESLGQALHGYDFDFCLQARAAGKKVVTAPFRLVHQHSLELASDLDAWVDAHMKIAEKWDGRMPDVGVAGGDWKLRARRAEAERGATRALAITMELQSQARAKVYERELSEVLESTSWRITAPLRKLPLSRRQPRRRSGETGAPERRSGWRSAGAKGR